MNQLDAFDAVHFPRARSTDASSSHAAAAQVERNGTAKAQAERVLAAMCIHDNVTSMELAEIIGMDRYAIARRCPELAAAGLLHRIEPTDATVPCAVSGKRVIRWRRA